MTTAAALLIPWAEKDGKLVGVETIPSGRNGGCVCPVCKKPVVARKGNIRTHHFAHDFDSACTGESVLHFVMKKLLFDRISLAFKAKTPLLARWKCTRKDCAATHQYDLLCRSVRVNIETSVENCRPDLVLYGPDDHPRIFLEVVYKHAPEESVAEYCRQNDIILCIVKIEGVEAIRKFEVENVLELDQFNRCLAPRCNTCGTTLYCPKLVVATVQCPRCKSPMQAAVKVNEYGSFEGPRSFPQEMLDEAKKAGVLICKKYSETCGYAYPANTCRNCGSFIGEWFLTHPGEEYREIFEKFPEHSLSFLHCCPNCTPRRQLLPGLATSSWIPGYKKKRR